MTDADLPELPTIRLVGDEPGLLDEFLDFYRAVFLRKMWGLDQDQLATSLTPSALTLGGLLKHMALVEFSWFGHRFADQPVPEPWASVDWDADEDWDFNSASDDTPAYLIDLFTSACEQSRRISAAAESLDQTTSSVQKDGRVWNLRWILIHMIEEYARHCGHADYLREAIDGAVGD